MDYRGTTKLMNVIEWIDKYIVPKLDEKIKTPFNHKVACYYGCLLVRPKEVAFDDAENPQVMENLVSALGATPIPFAMKTECCGAYHTVDRPDIIAERTQIILRSAHGQGADVVVVSCGAANRARLLLFSANDKHPRGLANGSDQVGRHYMFHNSKAMVALAHEPNHTTFQKTVCVNDWYLGDADFDYPMGNIQMTGKTNGTIMKGYAPLETFLMPGWSMDKIAEHAIDFWISSEDLPDHDNRVTVTSTGQIQLSYTPNNLTASQRLVSRLEAMLDRLYLRNHLVERQIYKIGRAHV